MRRTRREIGRGRSVHRRRAPRSRRWSRSAGSLAWPPYRGSYPKCTCVTTTTPSPPSRSSRAHLKSDAHRAAHVQRAALGVRRARSSAVIVVAAASPASYMTPPPLVSAGAAATMRARCCGVRRACAPWMSTSAQTARLIDAPSARVRGGSASMLGWWGSALQSRNNCPHSRDQVPLRDRDRLTVLALVRVVLRCGAYVSTIEAAPWPLASALVDVHSSQPIGMGPS